MIDDHKEEMAALYALDLLEGVERTQFEADLNADPELQKLVAQLREASSQLALTAPAVAPSEALKKRVLASIETTPQNSKESRTSHGAAAVRTNSRSSAKVIPFPIMGWAGWAVAACFAAGLIFLTTRNLTLRTDFVTLHSELELTKIETQDVRQQWEAERILNGKQITDLQAQGTALTAKVADLQHQGDLAQLKIAKLASLVGTPEAAAIAVWNPLTKEGVLTVEKLATLQSDQDYQLWVFDPKKSEPVSCSVFSVDEKGNAHYQFRPDQQIGTAAVFAVTRERKGGVPKPQGPIVLKGDL